jgi:hypothetical protein
MSQEGKISKRFLIVKVKCRGRKVILGGEIEKMLILKFHSCGRPMKGPTIMSKSIRRRKRMRLHLSTHQLLINP